MENLVQCESCGHGAPLHAAVGCGACECGCPQNLQGVIDDAIAAATTEIRALYQVATWTEDDRA